VFGEGTISMEWVGVMHAGYQLAEGTDAELALGEA
jgi:hypothetical protein